MFKQYFQLKREFLALDTNGDGNISVAEMEALLKSTQGRLNMTNKDIKNLIQKFDRDGDGTIDIDEFLNVITTGTKRDAIYKALIQRAGVRKAFERYDKDGNGFITRDEFKKVVEDKYQARLRPEKVDEMMKLVDINKDGKIDYEEFYKAFRYFPVDH